MRSMIFSIAVLAAFAVMSTATSHASIITLVSGNGAQGSADSLITYKLGPAGAGSPWGSTISVADFAGADAGPSARVLGTTVSAGVGRNSAWKNQLLMSTAQWISTAQDAGTANTGSTALYAMDFTVGPGAISAATLDFRFLVDNDLGDAGQGGVYLNGTELTPSTRRTNNSDFFKFDQSFAQFDVMPELVVGTNTLYVYTVNGGAGPAGLQFDAKFNVTQVPEPTSFVMFGLALVGLSRRRR